MAPSSSTRNLLSINVRARAFRVLLVASVIALGMALGTTGQNYATVIMRVDEPVSFMRMLSWPLMFWMSWAVLAPLFFELVWRYGPATIGRWRSGIVVSLGGVLAFFGHVALLCDFGDRDACIGGGLCEVAHSDFEDSFDHRIWGVDRRGLEQSCEDLFVHVAVGVSLFGFADPFADSFS